jgi:hypothetical protein
LNVVLASSTLSSNRVIETHSIQGTLGLYIQRRRLVHGVCDVIYIGKTALRMMEDSDK